MSSFVPLKVDFRGSKRAWRKASKPKRGKRGKKKGLTNLEKRQTKKIIANVKETKYGRFLTYDIRTVYGVNDFEPISSPPSLPGVQNPTSGACCTAILQTGDYLTPASINLNTALAGMPGGDAVYPFSGYSMLRGDSNRTIDGDYAYSQSQRVSIRIGMSTVRNQNQWESNYLSTRFRVLVVRPKPHSEAQTSSLAGALFLTPYGEKVGLASPNQSAKFMVHDALINPGQWEKKKEFRFELAPVIQPPSVLNPVSDNTIIPNYPLKGLPSMKQLDFYLDRPKKKLKFNNANAVGLNNYEPVNYEFTNYIIVLAQQGDGSQNGTLSGSGWTIQASGISKFKDA